MPALASLLATITAATAPALAEDNRWVTGSTAYCLQGTMANGQWVRAGSAAHNGLRLGTRFTVTPAVFGRRYWTVRDRIGHGTALDFWTPSCSAARAYGRRTVRMTLGWR